MSISSDILDIDNGEEFPVDEEGDRKYLLWKWMCEIIKRILQLLSTFNLIIG